MQISKEYILNTPYEQIESNYRPIYNIQIESYKNNPSQINLRNVSRAVYYTDSIQIKKYGSNMIKKLDELGYSKVLLKPEQVAKIAISKNIFDVNNKGYEYAIAEKEIADFIPKDAKIIEEKAAIIRILNNRGDFESYYNRTIEKDKIYVIQAILKNGAQIMFGYTSDISKFE
jgi:hypothetical protein